MRKTVKEERGNWKPSDKVYRMAHNTFGVDESNGWTHVVLHSTPVISRDPWGLEILRTGGWFTSTTKNRLNRFAVNARVFQKAFDWYVVTRKGTFRWEGNSVEVTPEGDVYNRHPHRPAAPIKEGRATKAGK